ncbi:hypothetical protein SCA6_014438 [Theobroma cacao]
MDHDGQRGSSTPSVVLPSLLSKRAKLQEELRNIERQVYDMETSYLQDPSQCGNVLKGFEGFLSSSKNTALLKRSRKFQPEDRLFSLSSVTSPAVLLHVNNEARATMKMDLYCFAFNCILGERLHDNHSSIYTEAHELNAEEIAAGRDDGKSDYGPGRPKGGGYFANGQGKPKKGRAREAKRMRHSSEPDFDYDDDPDVTL